MGKGTSVLSPQHTPRPHAWPIWLLWQVLPIGVDISAGQLVCGRAEMTACSAYISLHGKDENCHEVWVPIHPHPHLTPLRWPAPPSDQQTSKKHLQLKRNTWTAALLGLRVNRLPDPADPLPWRGVWLLLHVPVWNSTFFFSSPCHCTLPSLYRASRWPALFPPWLPVVPQQRRGCARHTAGLSLGFPLQSPRERCRGGQQLQCWLALDKWACHSTYWLAILWHFPSKTQMWRR